MTGPEPVAMYPMPSDADPSAGATAFRTREAVFDLIMVPGIDTCPGINLESPPGASTFLKLKIFIDPLFNDKTVVFVILDKRGLKTPTVLYFPSPRKVSLPFLFAMMTTSSPSHSTVIPCQISI